MQKERETSQTKRGEIFARLMEVVQQKKIIEAGRLVAIRTNGSFMKHTIYRVVAYDFAFMELVDTGCAFGHNLSEDYSQIYRYTDFERPELLLMSHIAKIEPIVKALPSIAESEAKRVQWFETRCTFSHPDLQRQFCSREQNHAQKNQHHFVHLPHNMTWPAHVPRPEHL